jgi:hypothetical protein
MKYKYDKVNLSPIISYAIATLTTCYRECAAHAVQNSLRDRRVELVSKNSSDLLFCRIGAAPATGAPSSSPGYEAQS